MCNRYNISRYTSPYRGVATPAKVRNQFLSLFYTDRLGLYPQVNLLSRQQFYGGIPQRGNLRASLAKARADIDYYIPSKTAGVLAVIDWEDWRPLWARNWGSKWIYRTLSVTHARQRDRSFTAWRATATAKKQFQAETRIYMPETLSLGSRLRPNYQWGFYLFPNCYNHGWMEPGYTGRCTKEVMGQNDELLWLWEASSALYPSIYLQEALRVSTLPAKPLIAPVYVETRPVFIDQNRRFLSQGDLGPSGRVLLWRPQEPFCGGPVPTTMTSSFLVPHHHAQPLHQQRDFLCQGNGHCVRKHYESDHYLHLSSGNFRILRARGTDMVPGSPSLADLTLFSGRFICQCYAGRTCSPKLPIHLSKALAFKLKHQGSHCSNDEAPYVY
nr:hyaluronidase PH-20-like [Oncorhynchus nerka]